MSLPGGRCERRVGERTLATGPERVFLGWDEPGVVSACDYLCSRCAGMSELDLSALTVVISGGRAGRMLTALLVDRAEAMGRALSPPNLITPSEVGPLLLGLHQTPAGPLARRLAWIEALKSIKADALSPLVPHRAADDDLRAWGELAALLDRCHVELAGELVLFEDVPRLAAEVGRSTEDQRWLAAARAQTAYEAKLRQWGLSDADLDRLHAVRENRPVRDGDVMLLGVPDLGKATRAVLTRAGDRVTVLICAPHECADRFDELGCVLPDRWEGATIPIHDDQIHFAQTPADQADRAFAFIATHGADRSVHEIVIGAPDEEVVPHLARTAERTGRLKVHYAARMTVAQTPPYRLLAAVGAYARERSFAAMAALVRHPDVERYIARELSTRDGGAACESWLDVLDAYQMEHLHGEVDGRWFGAEGPATRTLTRVYDAIETMLGSLAPARSISQCAAAVLAILRRVYGDSVMNRDDPAQRRVVESCLAIRAALDELASINARDGAEQPSASVIDVLELALAEAGPRPIPDEPDEEAIDVVGWLELPMDPAPVVVITGMNEGRVPAASGRDPFLPDSLRTALGIADHRRRLARDAYLLSMVVSARKDIALIVGRQSGRGDPLSSSRLLFSCDEQTLVTRVRRFTDPSLDTTPRVSVISRLTPGDDNRFLPVPIIDTDPVTSMTVTSFRTYLKSPYEFYLEHVLRLAKRDDSGVEMDAMTYGSVLHEALECFAAGEARDSDDPERIEACLCADLEAIALRRFGMDPPVAVWVQLQLARQRLRSFAMWQAGWVRSGWRIAVKPEWKPAKERAVLVVDDEPMQLRGKIDRIDRHDKTGQLAILDYKTGDTVKKPDAAHRNRDREWRDLQLPLYRHLAAELGPPDDVLLGYIAIPKDPKSVGLLEAGWSGDDLRDADDAACDVVRRVRRHEFDDIGDRPPTDGVFGALCGLGLIGHQTGMDDEGGDT